MADVDVFEELVLPHLGAAHNLTRWRMRNPDDAEDVVQDACMRARPRLAAALAADDRYRQANGPEGNDELQRSSVEGRGVRRRRNR